LRGVKRLSTKETDPFLVVHLKALNQSIDKLVLSRSEMTIEPGLCVMHSDGRARSTASCGVTPQAQNTGSSSGRICGGVPLNSSFPKKLHYK